jgi:hypothetical protein
LHEYLLISEKLNAECHCIREQAGLSGCAHARRWKHWE